MFAFGNSNLLLWVQQFSLVCGGEVAWMIPRLTSCPEMAQVLSASKPAQLVPSGGGVEDGWGQHNRVLPLNRRTQPASHI